jgi:hypothetical protein
MKHRGVAVDVAVALSTQAPSSGVGRVATGSVSAGLVAEVREALSERDWAVIRDVARLRMVAGTHLERLHFADLSEMSRAVVRRRVLGRLVKWRVLATLERRIGGVRAGSAGLVYCLDTGGQRLVGVRGRVTRPGRPGLLFVQHVLAVSELYVALVERTRGDENMRLESFDAEPACWWPDGQRGKLKPDAYVRLSTPTYRDHWWIEADRATESLPTIRRKLNAYVSFWRSGQLGPGDTMPRVLLTVPDAKRYSEIVRLIRQLPTDSQDLFIVAVAKDAVTLIVRCLNQPD